MQQVLVCIANLFMWLFEDYHFKFCDSAYHPAFGNGWVELRNHNLIVRFVSDRNLVLIEVAPAAGWTDTDGFSLDLLGTLLGIEGLSRSIITPESAKLFRNHFPEIVKVITETEPGELRRIMAGLEKERAARLFK